MKIKLSCLFQVQTQNFDYKIQKLASFEHSHQIQIPPYLNFQSDIKIPNLPQHKSILNKKLFASIVSCFHWFAPLKSTYYLRLILNVTKFTTRCFFFLRNCSWFTCCSRSSYACRRFKIRKKININQHRELCKLLHCEEWDQYSSDESQLCMHLENMRDKP